MCQIHCFFGFYPTVPRTEVNVYITSEPTRCNTEVDYYFTVKNEGNTVLKDGRLVMFITAAALPYVPVGALNPGETDTFS